LIARRARRISASRERRREVYAALARLGIGAPLPRAVLDLPGGFGKIPVEAPHLMQSEDGRWGARDRFGVEHRYEGAAEAPLDGKAPDSASRFETVSANQSWLMFGFPGL
jgi:L-lysine 2,3-aminomutase